MLNEKKEFDFYLLKMLKRKLKLQNKLTAKETEINLKRKELIKLMNDNENDLDLSSIEENKLKEQNFEIKFNKKRTKLNDIEFNVLERLFEKEKGYLDNEPMKSLEDIFESLNSTII